MFAARYFATRMFAARYWPKVGAAPDPGAGGETGSQQRFGYRLTWMY